MAHTQLSFSRAFRACLMAVAVFAVGCGDDDSRGVECTNGAILCNDVCTAVQSSYSNCGACGASCTGTQVCQAGVCTGEGTDAGPGTDVGPGTDTGAGGFDAGPSTSDCSPACDMERSNSCGQMGGAGPFQCLCGVFAQCPAGQACVPSGGSFICANTQFDPMNCGMIGNCLLYTSPSPRD